MMRIESRSGKQHTPVKALIKINCYDNPVGSTCAPCKHKAAVATHFGRASFSVTPTADPCQRALYHFIALGKTMPAHCYRNTGDPSSEPDFEAFIKAHISVEPEKQAASCETNLSKMEVEVLCQQTHLHLSTKIP